MFERIIGITFLLVLFPLAGWSQTLHDSNCGVTSSSFTLDWSAVSYTPGSLSQTFSNVEGSGYSVTVTVSGQTGTLATENGVSTPGVTTSLSGGVDALHVSSTGLDSIQKVTLTLSFSPALAGDIAFDLYNIIESGTGPGQLMELVAYTASGYAVIPNLTDNGTPSWELEGPGIIDGNAASTVGTNDQVGVNFKSISDISSFVISMKRCTSCTNSNNTEFALGNITFCLSPDTDQDGIADWQDLDDDNDGIPDEIEKCPSSDRTTAEWDNMTFTTGSTSNSYVLPDGTGMTLNVSSNGASIVAAETNTQLTGGQGAGTVGLFLNGNQNLQENSIDVSMSWDQAIDSLEFTIFDVDMGSNQFVDSLIIIGYYNEYVVFPTLTPSANNSTSQNKAVGTAATADNLASANVFVAFVEPIDSLMIFYGNGSTAPITPGNQWITVWDLSYIGDCGSTDTDGDGVDDYLDIDSDNDGILDYIELQASSASPTVPTGNDANGNGIDDSFEAMSSPIDTDGDGIPDFQDPDSDNDGALDSVEAYDTDNDGIADVLYSGVDSDGDGLDDAYDVVNGFNATSNVTNGGQTSNDLPNLDVPATSERDWREDDDVDGDGIQNYADIDNDNDGILDINEGLDGNNPSGDRDGDGIQNWSDTTDDGTGGDGSATEYTDSNGDGIPDVYDIDGDGIPNHKDPDADGDGIADIIEANGTDSDGNGIVDGAFTDTDGDGWSDVFDSDNGGTALFLEDVDGDGNYNHLDIDSDDDGIVDIIESQATGSLIAPSGLDSDRDGIDDNFDVDEGNHLTQPFNTDGTDNPDYKDTDSDNDLTSDAVEAWDTNNDEVAETIATGTDSDRDGLDDAYDALTQTTGNASTNNITNNGQTSSSFPNNETPGTTERDWREVDPRDTDSDGVLDVFDIDDDNDGILDIYECPNSSSYPVTLNSFSGVTNPTNAVGSPNNGFAVWTTNNNYAIYDFGQVYAAGTQYAIIWRERAGETGTASLVLSESQNNSSYIQHTSAPTTNSTTSITSVVTSENSFRYLRISKTNPPSSTDFEIDAIALIDNNSACDTDGDGIPNLRDLDSDNDGITDLVEALGVDTDGDGRIDGNFTDTDGDGLHDTYDSDNGGVDISNADSDGDGIQNSLDLDVDNDGIPDVVMVGGTDINGDGRLDNFQDGDGDGLSDLIDGDADNDGTAENSANAFILTDIDGNNDGIPDDYTTGDTDNDGVPNFLDLDADNDGIPNVIEAGGTDVNGDGRADNYSDGDGDGFNDIVDGDPSNSLPSRDDSDGSNLNNALVLTGSDSNDDGRPDFYTSDDFDDDFVLNFFDLDSDDDGILDITEAGGTDADGDGQVDSFQDNDGDGFHTEVDGDPANLLSAGNDNNGTNISGVLVRTGDDADLNGAPDFLATDDFDSDDHFNFLDIDADNDGIVDNTEGQSTVGYIAPDNLDSDGDGIDDAYDADDALFGGIGSQYALSDIDVLTDPDSPDYLDLDSDDDGVVDETEGHDSDGDGTADSGSIANTGVNGGSTDADGDGLLDGFDNNVSGKDPTNSGFQPSDYPNYDNPLSSERSWREEADADNDGILDDIDEDDDNDGITDADEGCGSGIASYTSGIGSYEVSYSGEISISIAGGSGGGGQAAGGSGALVSAVLSLSDGDIIRYVIGAGSAGGSNTAGGAGSSGLFVNNDLVMVAGGGAGGDNSSSALGGGATATTTGGSGSGSNAGAGGINGAGGAASGNSNGAGGGGGINSAGGSQTGSGGSAADLTPSNGVTLVSGGASGSGNSSAGGSGFTGGGGGSSSYSGAGGGYSGGGASGNGSSGASGGGGSYLNTAHSSYVSGSISGGTAGGGGAAFSAGSPGYIIFSVGCADSDGDGIPNSKDLDSDNDGIPDLVEAGGTDSDLNGRVDGFTDTDSDGLHDAYDTNNGGAEIAKTDSDGDNVPDYLDLDSDDDGIPDVEEAGSTDNDLNGMVDDTDDSDFDGWSDQFDGDNGGTNQTRPDSDGDGLMDYLDLDSDNDGIIDNQEGQKTIDYQEKSNLDANRNGWDDQYDPSNGGTAFALSDYDGDNIPDYLDADSDNDGKDDYIEGFDDDINGNAWNDLKTRADAFEAANGNPAYYINTENADADEYPDWMEDSDNDGVANYLDPQSVYYHDADNDGLIDLFDSDNNGSLSLLPDMNANGSPDFRDASSQVALPITLVSFEAIKERETVRLEWKTSVEINNDFFTIEHSTNGFDFEPIARVNGAGNSLVPISYSTIHETPSVGMNYYRLVQTDLDGTEHEEGIRSVAFTKTNAQLVAFPSPFQNEFTLKMDGLTDSKFQVLMVDFKGAIVYERTLEIEHGQSSYLLEVPEGAYFSAGTYKILVISPTASTSIDVVKY